MQDGIGFEIALGVIRRALLIFCVMVTGCAAQRGNSAKPQAAMEYEPASASALAFDSPVAPLYPLPGLERGPREPSAFAGYQDTVTEFFAVSVDDHQSSDPYNDTYDRESVSVKVGVRYR